MALSSNWQKLKSESGKSKKISVKSNVKPNKVTKSRKPMQQKAPVIVRKTIEPKSQGRIKSVVDDITKQIKVRADQRELEKELGLKPSVELQKIIDETSKVKGVSKNVQEIGKYLAIDCEFVGVGIEGGESALARVSIVNFYGHTVLDEYVKPKERVVDFRTWVSGIRPSDLHNAKKFEDVQKEVSDLLKGRILVGHAVYHDLDALFLSHPKSMIRDTSRHVPYRQKYSNGKTPSLKKLAKEILNVDIQGAEHSSVEDAKVTMLLYKFDKKIFEQLAKSKFHTKN